MERTKKVVWGVVATRKILVPVFAAIFVLLQIAAGMTAPKELKYFYKICRFPASTADSSIVRFDISIPYNRMVFVFRDSVYEARIQFGVFLLDRDENLMLEKNWRHQILVDTYEETLSDSAYLQFSTQGTVPVGEYKVIYESLDENVDIPKYERFKLKIPNFAKRGIVPGDILLFDGQHDFSREDYALLVPSPRSLLRKDFTIYSEALLLLPDEEVRAVLIWQDRYREVRRDTVAILRQGQRLKLYRAFSLRDVPQGHYRLRLQLSGSQIKKTESETEVEIEKRVELYSEEALDKAIEQLYYIGEGAAYDSLKRARTFEQKKYWFYRFWQEYYPAADSLHNPAREEYYRRVRYANREFGDGIEGWRTDRGRIYILYGPPDDIQESTDQNLRNYQIWIYNDLRKQFVFVQEHGFGEYRLVREM